MTFSIKQLRAFVSVAELASFRIAAERLYLTPSAVSVLVKELERELGFTLFERTTRRVALSLAGRDFLNSAVKVLKEAQAAALTASDLKNRTTGVVLVAAPLVVASSLLPNAVAAFYREHKNVVVRPVDCPVEGLVDAVSDAKVDLAVGPDRPVGKEVRRTNLFESPWVLWCSPEHPLAAQQQLTWADLSRHAVIAAGRDYETRIAEAFRKSPAAQRFAPSYVVDNVSTALGLAAANLGVTLSPAYVGVMAKSFGLIARRFSKSELTRHLSIYSSTARALNPAAASFLAFIGPLLISQQHAINADLTGRAQRKRKRTR